MTDTRNGLRLFTCTDCAHVFQIARGFCPRCSGTTLTSDARPRQGTVTACTEVHVTPLGSPTGEVPFWIVLVQTDEGPVIMASSAAPLAIGAHTTLTAQAPDHGPYVATS